MPAEKIYYLCIISLLALSCEKSEDICKVDFCDATQQVIGTIEEGYGMLDQKIDGTYFIKVSDEGVENPAYFIKCQSPEIILPDIGLYVKFGAKIKQKCQDDISSNFYDKNIYLTSIEPVVPRMAENCEQRIEIDTLNVEKIADEVKILMLSIDQNCLQILVRYQGGCTTVPSFKMTSEKGYFATYPLTKDFYLEGEVEADCEQINYQILQYDLHSIYRETGIEELIIDFHQDDKVVHILYRKS